MRTFDLLINSRGKVQPFPGGTLKGETKTAVIGSCRFNWLPGNSRKINAFLVAIAKTQISDRMEAETQ